MELLQGTPVPILSQPIRSEATAWTFSQGTWTAIPDPRGAVAEGDNDGMLSLGYVEHSSSRGKVDPPFGVWVADRSDIAPYAVQVAPQDLDDHIIFCVDEPSLIQLIAMAQPTVDLLRAEGGGK